MELQEKGEENDGKDVGYNLLSQNIICFIFCHLNDCFSTQYYCKIWGLLMSQWSYRYVTNITDVMLLMLQIFLNFGLNSGVSNKKVIAFHRLDRIFS